MGARLQSELASRHQALGAELRDWNGVGTVFDYQNQSTEDEHDCVRERVGVFDVSGLKKFWVEGDDATAVLNHACVRDVGNLEIGQAGYTPILTEQGTITDDAIVHRLGENRYFYVGGTGKSDQMIRLSSEGKDCDLTLDDSLQNLAVQGPKAVELVNSLTADDISGLRFFRFVETKFQGIDVIIARTGYTGERGYEIYAHRDHIATIWDTLFKAGEQYGVMACGFDCLDKVRIESALLFYPYDMDESLTIHEVGLGWTIPRNKNGDYRGRVAQEQAVGNEKQKLVGLVIDHHEMCSGEAELYINDQKVGRITSPVYSHRMGNSIALAIVDAEYALDGMAFNVKEGDMDATAVAHPLAFYDPEKKRLRA